MTNPSCLKCGTELIVNDEGVAPVLCESCAGVATKRARRSLPTGTLREYPVSACLLAINVAVFLGMIATGSSAINPSFNALLKWGGNFGPFTTGGEYWRLITASFLHGGIIHIGFNLWCLYSLGPVCERVFGRLQTLAIYLLTGAGGWLLSIAYDPHRLSIGASGAIFGIAGAVVAGARFGELSLTAGQKKALISTMVSFLVISFAWGGFSDSVDNMAHLGGFVSGLMIGLPLGGFARKHKAYQVIVFAVTSIVLFAAGHELVQEHGPQGLLYRADAAMKQHYPEKAITLLEKYRTIKPDDDETLVWLGDLYANNNQRDQATAAYQQALKVNPQSEDAKEGLQDLQASAVATSK